jgi:outer membrane lipoprotein LolB
VTWPAGLAACFTAALLVGCVNLAPPSAARDEVISGRLSVQVEGDAKRSFDAAFELIGTPERGSLALSTPLGTRLAQADWSAEQVRLRSREGERVYADLDSLSEDALGERVPLGALFDWLRGRPWPGTVSSPTERGFAQLGWQVDLSRYREGWVAAERSALPRVRLRARLDAVEGAP